MIAYRKCSCGKTAVLCVVCGVRRSTTTVTMGNPDGRDFIKHDDAWRQVHACDFCKEAAALHLLLGIDLTPPSRI